MREDIWKWAITVPAGSHSFIVVCSGAVGNGKWGVGSGKWHVGGRRRALSPIPYSLFPTPLLHSFASFAMISFMISEAPAPMVFNRASRHARPIGYSVV